MAGAGGSRWHRRTRSRRVPDHAYRKPLAEGRCRGRQRRPLVRFGAPDGIAVLPALRRCRKYGTKRRGGSGAFTPEQAQQVDGGLYGSGRVLADGSSGFCPDGALAAGAAQSPVKITRASGPGRARLIAISASGRDKPGERAGRGRENITAGIIVLDGEIHLRMKSRVKPNLATADQADVPSPKKAEAEGRDINTIIISLNPSGEPGSPRQTCVCPVNPALTANSPCARATNNTRGSSSITM